MKNKIIQILKSHDGHMSGEEMSQKLKVSRAAIWKNVEELRHQGYEILAVPNLGYRLASCPDKLFPSEIQCGLKTKILGKKIIYFDSVQSTMEEAFRLGMEGSEEGTVVCAEGQTKGKGRLGRSWMSPKGKGIYMSIILRPNMSPGQASQLTLLSAVALCESVRRVTGVQATIKWPNDLLVGKKKLAGILTELNAEMDRVWFVVVGVGINVNTSLHALPEGSTSLKVEAKQSFLRVALMQDILESFEQWYERLAIQGFKAVTKRWRELSSTLGRRVCIHNGEKSLEGEAVDINEFGALIICNDDGVKMTHMAGDVVEV